MDWVATVDSAIGDTVCTNQKKNPVHMGEGSLMQLKGLYHFECSLFKKKIAVKQTVGIRCSR